MATKTDTALEKALAAALKAAGGKSTGSKAKRKPFGKTKVGRLWRKEREGWKERKSARKNHRKPKIKARRTLFAERMKARTERLRFGSAHCGSCGARMSGKDAAGHVCGGSKAGPEKFSKAKAQLQAIARKEAKRRTRGGTDRDAKRNHRQQRKDAMTRPARMADTVARRAVLIAGFAGRCAHCNAITYYREDHDCQPSSSTTNATPSTAPANSTPNATPSATPSPTQGKAGPAMTSPNKNGSGGGGGPSAHAQAIAQAMHNWAQSVPGTHAEMEADMRSMQWLFASAIPGAIQARGQAMIAKQFHPETIRPLLGVESNCAQAGAHFMECYLAITMMYKALLEHYAAGTPDPGRTYLSDGRVPAAATP